MIVCRCYCYRGVNIYVCCQTLVARLNFLTGMGSLAAAPQLVSVDLYDNRFKKIDGLTKLTKLKKLDLSFNECRVIQVQEMACLLLGPLAH